MDISTLRTSLLLWANSIVNPGTQVIPSDSDNPSPQTTWVSLKVTTFTQVGMDDYIGDPDDHGDAIVTGNREFICNLLGTGTGSLQALSDLRDSLQSEAIRADLEENGIVFVIPESPIQNLSGLIEQTSVEKGALDIRFRTDSNITDSVGLIEHAELEGTFKRQPGDPDPIVRDIDI